LKHCKDCTKMVCAKEDRFRGQERSVVGEMARIERGALKHCKDCTKMDCAKEDRFRGEERSVVGEMARNERAALVMKNCQDSR
jgi:hypothetical protein